MTDKAQRSDGDDNADGGQSVSANTSGLSDIHKAFGVTASAAPDVVQLFSTNADVNATVRTALPDDIDIVTLTDEVYDVNVVITCVETLLEDGDTVTAALDERDAYIPLLVITEMDQDAFWDTVNGSPYVAYIDDIITKPLTPETLRTRLSTLGSLHSARVSVAEREAEIQDKQAKLVRREEIITVLQRILRHNIRNDMSVVKGYASMVESQLDNTDPIETIKDTVDKVVHLSERTHDVTKDLTTTSEKRMINVHDLVQSARDAAIGDGECSVQIAVDNSITVNAHPSLETAVEELITNACEHTNSTVIRVDGEIDAGRVVIRISDDGDGIPNIEQTVLEDGSETPLEHGSGLGLWMVNWIIKDHDGDIYVDSGDDGTTIEVRIPRM